MSHPALEILYEDQHLLVASKPSGVLSVATRGATGRTLADLLAAGGQRAVAVHRLDREVSGALLCAKDAATRAALEQLFRERALSKTYWAMAVGAPPRDAGELKFPILEQGAHARVSALGKPALTRYRVLARAARASEVEIDLVTGRYNQIRVHFAHAGWPLVGERKYGKFRDDPFRFSRVALHAWRLSFTHPLSGRAIQVEAPLPPDLVELRQRALAR